MTIHQNKQTGRYYALVSGKRVSLKTTNREDAEALAKAANLRGIELADKAALLSAETIQRLTYGKRVDCKTAYAAWDKHLPKTDLAPLTAHAYRGKVSSFLSDKLSLPVQALTEDHVDAFVNPGSPVSCGTRKNNRSALLSFFTYVQAKGFRIGNPAVIVQVRTHELSHSQMEKPKKAPVFDVDTTGLPEFWRFAVALVKETGMRLSDIAQLEWASVSGWGYGMDTHVTFYTDKTRVRISLPVSPVVAHLVAEISQTTAFNQKFLFPREAAIMQDPKRRSSLSQEFTRLTGVGFHSLRVGFSTRLSLEGESITEIQKRLGHASAKTTEGYIRK